MWSGYLPDTNHIIGQAEISTAQASDSGGQVIRVPRKRKCPGHPDQPTMLRPSSKSSEHALLDIAFTKTGCRKTIVRYRGKESYCPYCGSKFVPPQVKEVRRYRYSKGFHAWVAYLRVALRLSCRLVEKFTRDLFHEDISRTTIVAFFHQTADAHELTEELLLRRILQSRAIHVDETKMSILGVHQQVWGITNGREVVFRLTETRETGFLQELLNGYQGVLVSDFYGGYDAITCRQQKCLVHLIRDLNEYGYQSFTPRNSLSAPSASSRTMSAAGWIFCTAPTDCPA